MPSLLNKLNLSFSLILFGISSAQAGGVLVEDPPNPTYPSQDETYQALNAAQETGNLEIPCLSSFEVEQGRLTLDFRGANGEIDSFRGGPNTVVTVAQRGDSTVLALIDLNGYGYELCTGCNTDGHTFDSWDIVPVGTQMHVMELYSHGAAFTGLKEGVAVVKAQNIGTAVYPQVHHYAAYQRTLFSCGTGILPD